MKVGTGDLPSPSRVNKAGTRLRHWLEGQEQDPSTLQADIDVIDAFRASHQRPMNAASMGLRSIVRTVGCRSPEVSQRLKRWESLTSKLLTQRTLALSRMQDLAGCRAVLDDMDEIYRVWKRLETNRPVLYVSDYIARPKPSGYRGVHVVVEYGSPDGNYPPRPVEIQLRTRVMHQWAISIEDMNARLSEQFRTHEFDLKRGIGPAEVLDVFSVTSEVMAAAESHQAPSADMIGRLKAAQKAFTEYLRRMS
ncbi:MAG: RelA/SpoT domain-containing protein [Actinomyces urogenitalis]|nr:RelA/SpoT domain-containing protein [Actinomyces urogenitalis]